MKPESLFGLAPTFAAFFVLCSLPLVGQAQTFNGSADLRAEGTSYHVYARSGEPTIQVFVFGSVGATGIYEVGVETDMGQLLALTGGVAAGPEMPGQRQRVTVRLLRRQGGQRSVVYDEPLETMLRNPGGYPELQDGDVFEVNTEIRTRRDWLELVSTVASFTTFALAIDALMR